MKHPIAAALIALLPTVASARNVEPAWGAPGSLVAVSVELDGRASPLYPAPDGSGRFYLEARAGAAYAVRLDNRSNERLAVLLTVDGLNAISGDRQPASGPGRMYILDPWDGATIRGWRTSLDEVRRFTFVDEKSSYASRTGQASGKMGWIEMSIYRERRPVWHEPRMQDRDREEYGGADRPAPSAKADDQAGRVAQAPGASGEARSYPGTGWGDRTNDHATIVDFQAASVPAERVTLRYEYRGALQALGILPRPWDRDRLREREQGQDGFARPPAW